ncbi:MFS transporter [Lentzea sp. NPDC034063]|uniref:MFS transporter n=1 Tax=unclassified Lentzea TaxID=2643253 RepID=UPI003403AFF0
MKNLSSEPSSPVDTSTDARPVRSGAVLACVSFATVLVVGLVAAINLAVPMFAASDLHPGASQLLWIVDAYVVAFACLVIPGGAAGDRFGRKGVLTAGLVVVALGAAACAAAPSIGLLLAARAITGIGAALVLPNCVGVLVHATPPERRARTLGTWGVVSGMGGLIGNTAGAALLAVTGTWQSLFIATVPIALAGAIWVSRVVPRSTRTPRHLDPLGTVLLILATVAVLIGVIEGPELGWDNGIVVTAFGCGVVLVAAWTWSGLRSDHPLLDPRLFRIPLLSASSLGMFVMFFGSFGLFYLNASLLQYVRGYSVLQAGLSVLPLAAPLLLGSRFVPGLVSRFGIPTVLTIAFAAIGSGLIGLSTAMHHPYLAYAAWLVIIGTGFALALPCLSAELAVALPPHQAGIAGGLQSITRELGSALGVAVVGTIVTSSFTANLAGSLRSHEPVPHTVAEALAASFIDHRAVLDAFADAAATGLRWAGVLTVAAGLAVITVAVRAAAKAE